MLCIPMGRDQGENAARIVASGSGIKLKRKADASTIKAAAERVLTEPSYREAAQRFAQAIAAGVGDTDPVLTIEGLLKTRAAPGIETKAP